MPKKIMASSEEKYPIDIQLRPGRRIGRFKDFKTQNMTHNSQHEQSNSMSGDESLLLASQVYEAIQPNLNQVAQVLGRAKSRQKRGSILFKPDL